MRRLVPALLVLVALWACSRKGQSTEPPAPAVAPAPSTPPNDPSAPGAVLFFSADVRGYLGPCGCSENMRGGVARAAFQVREARQGALPVLYVDGGESLFGEPTLKPDQVPQEERKARALAEVFQDMGLAVRAVSTLDDTRGAAFRRSLGLPELGADGAKVFAAGARQVGVVSATDAAGLKQGGDRARAQGATFVVGLFQGTLPEAQRAVSTAEATGVDLVLATHTASEFDGEQNTLTRDAVPVVGLQSKGRSLLRVDLAYGPTPGRFSPRRSPEESEKEAASIERRLALLDTEINLPGADPRLKELKQKKYAELVERRQTLLTAPVAPSADSDTFTVRFVPLESTLPSDPAAEAVVRTYDADVGKMNLEWARLHGQDCPAPARGESAFVGNAVCAGCHEESFPVYEASKHPHAWKTLEDQGKQFHLNCTGCHVTGWERPGGVCRLDKVAGRESVGCESCHGPGSRHAEDPSPDNVIARPDEAVCVTCHNRENSPHFDFATYLPRVLGPGHGSAPAVK
ncbi:MAG: cytochrome c family protein [Cystobacter sp.]